MKTKSNTTATAKAANTNRRQELEAKAKESLRITPLNHLRAIAAQIYRNGSKTDADAILTRVQQAEAEHAALVAVAEVAKELREYNHADNAGFSASCGEKLDVAIANLAAVREGGVK